MLKLNKIIRSYPNSLHEPCAISTNPAWSQTRLHNASGMQETMRTTTPVEPESRVQPQHKFPTPSFSIPGINNPDSTIASLAEN
ncbi:hypothetical protein IFM46972_01509 [Aspergillus udagawae]|uniref:Uncharacterized protein n=1 Tax=Aspergillus udagawae TaxID=91492 RepID=A0A8H3RIE1_9EURO|nr:hypothetical protein IFM46972_01509 [Aspergillus udagawae]